MHKIIKIGLVSVCIVVQSNAKELISPIHSTNQYINQVIFYRPYAQSAMINHDENINISISQSNIFQKSDNIIADFGLTTLDFTYYYPISDSLEVSFNYPFYYISKGFLDNSLDAVHSVLGITTTRENDGHKDNQLNYIVTDKINKKSSYFASGNPQIELKYLLYNKDNFFVSTNAGIKIPIGNTKDGFTSGKVDIMSGLQMQKNYESISWIFNFAVTLNGEKELAPDIVSEKARYFFYIGNKFALPADYFGKTDFLFAYQYSSAPYKSSDKKFNSYTNLFQFAVRKYLENDKYIDMFFNQNTIPRHNEADVTIGVSYHF